MTYSLAQLREDEVRYRARGKFDLAVQYQFQADLVEAGVDPLTRVCSMFDGPDPVVAHPPCQLWINYAALNYKRYGGAHNRPGNDRGCFAAALDCVRRFGGVLEHPAGSKAWEYFQLEIPRDVGWTMSGDNEWVCEIWQSAYGHKARKRTWLVYVGDNEPSQGNWARAYRAPHQCGWFDRIKPTLSKLEASRTPPLFAEWLVSLAREVTP